MSAGNATAIAGRPPLLGPKPGGEGQALNSAQLVHGGQFGVLGGHEPCQVHDDLCLLPGRVVLQRAVEGPLAGVRGGPPEDATYEGAAASLPRVWIAVRANLRRVLEQVTIAELAAGDLPPAVAQLTEDSGDWVTR